MSNATVIEVELLSGRYHAHLWGEAQFGMAGPEWPPSPWRLLRALASSWFCARPHPSSEDARDRLLEALGRSGAPEIWLPRSSVNELRYYQPVRLGGSDRVLHHDHFAVAEGGRFWFRFNVTLELEQRKLLDELLERLCYLGRSESRARLRRVELDEPPKGVWRVAPRGDAHQTSPTVYRRVLCTTPEFQASNLWSLHSGKPGYPPHLVDALLSEKMPLPRGARWVEYEVPAAAVVYEIRSGVVASRTEVKEIPVAEIRFRLCRRIPIPLRYMVALARAFRNAVVEEYRARSGQISRILSGREPDGTVARGHQHAYYLPRLRPGNVALDELVVRVPGGRLTPPELNALLGVTHLHLGGSGYPITVVPEAVEERATPSKAARQWRSITPFLPPLRHRRGRSETCVEQQIVASIEQTCGKRPVHVENISGPGGLGRVTSILAHEYASNNGGWTFTRRLGYWLAVTFDEPVNLHPSLGADAHFGAGQFDPAYEDTA